MLLDATGELTETWVWIDDNDAIPAQGQIIVPHARLDEALGLRAAAGVVVPNTLEPAELVPVLPRLGLIAVTFPSFADGRGFSIGRRLRDLGFAGHLRATGPVIADQFAYLLACGFDQVQVPEEIAARQPAHQWAAQLTRITLGYQRGREIPSILDRRLPAT